MVLKDKNNLKTKHWEDEIKMKCLKLKIKFLAYYICPKFGYLGGCTSTHCTPTGYGPVHNIILHYIILYYIILYDNTLYNIILHALRNINLMKMYKDNP